MRAYQEARFDELREKVARAVALTGKEERELNTLCAEKQREEDAEPRPWFYGGDYVDAF